MDCVTSSYNAWWIFWICTVLDDHSKFKGYRTHNINLQLASYVF